MEAVGKVLKRSEMCKTKCSLFSFYPEIQALKPKDEVVSLIVFGKEDMVDTSQDPVDREDVIFLKNFPFKNFFHFFFSKIFFHIFF